MARTSAAASSCPGKFSQRETEMKVETCQLVVGVFRLVGPLPPPISPPKSRVTRRNSLRMYPFGMILAWCRSGGHKIRNVFFPCLLACLSWLAWLLTVANLFFMGDKHWPLCSARLVVLCQGDFRNDFSLSGGVKVVIRGWHFRN